LPLSENFAGISFRGWLISKHLATAARKLGAAKICCFKVNKGLKVNLSGEFI